MKRRPQRRRNWPRAGVVLANKRRSLHSGTSAAPVACGSGFGSRRDVDACLCLDLSLCWGYESLFLFCFVDVILGGDYFCIYFFFVCVLAVIT